MTADWLVKERLVAKKLKEKKRKEKKKAILFQKEITSWKEKVIQ